MQKVITSERAVDYNPRHRAFNSVNNYRSSSSSISKHTSAQPLLGLWEAHPPSPSDGGCG